MCLQSEVFEAKQARAQAEAELAAMRDSFEDLEAIIQELRELENREVMELSEHEVRLAVGCGRGCCCLNTHRACAEGGKGWM